MRGGEFLIRTEDQPVWTPEQLNEEQRLVAEMCKEFLDREVFPNLDRIDEQEEGLMATLLDKAGQLGMLGLTIPEEYGGAGRDFNTATVMTDVIGQGHSFPVSLLAHTGIGSLPILYFGTEEQKKKYLPRLATGELKSCYCLTEPHAGSDALSIKTVAQPTENGYLLNGQKIWITNSGFADLFIVFAKVAGEHFTAFIVEKAFGGVSLGKEEKKMGIKGSSTRQVYFDNCPVPRENVLGEVGRGHLVALNVLNIGRFKLAAACVGAARRAFNLAVGYARERVQFGKPIVEFGAIKEKIAQMVARLYGVESAVYRVSDMIREAEQEAKQKGNSAQAMMHATREYAVEAALLKVAGSEMLDYVVDEAVQIYGGYGYSEEYPVARAYRDSRINRIFEGTNEINRLSSVALLMRKALAGELDLLTPIQQAQKELTALPATQESIDFGSGEGLRRAIANMKKALLLLSGALVSRYGEKLAEEQEVVLRLSDMMSAILLAESAALRAKGNSATAARVHLLLAGLLTYEQVRVFWRAFEEVCWSAVEGDTQKMLLMAGRRLLRVPEFNVVEAQRQVCEALLKKGVYPFGGIV